MKARDRFSPEHQIVCGECGKPIEHEIADETMQVWPCMNCIEDGREDYASGFVRACDMFALDGFGRNAKDELADALNDRYGKPREARR